MTDTTHSRFKPNPSRRTAAAIASVRSTMVKCLDNRPLDQKNELLRDNEGITLKGLERLLPFTAKQLDKMEKAGSFPARRKDSSNRNVWSLTEVLAWVREHVRVDG